MQQAIVRYLRGEGTEVPWIPFVGSANGAYLGGGSDKCDKSAGARRWATLRSTGCSAGYPDLFMHRRGHNGEIGLAVELKIVDGVLSRAQKQWRDALIAEGCHFAVVHSLDEFKRTLDEYLHGRTARAPRARVASRRGTSQLPLVID